MAIKPDYEVGTVSVSAGGTVVTGVGTLWVSATIQAGDTFKVKNLDAIIASVDSNTQITLKEPWTGGALTASAYAIRFQPDGSRLSAATRTLVELLGNGNLTAFAALAGSLNMVPMFTGAGALTLVPKLELTQGVDYDVQVDTLAERAGYDGQSTGFSVLVSDVGDGRSALYSKASNTLGDWTDPAYLTGPSGSFQSKGDWSGATAYEAGDVVFYQGSSWIAVVDHTNHTPPTLPTTSNTWWTILVRAGSGFTFKGAYSGATAYLKDDVVIDQGSSWIALQATTGNAPPALPTTSNANWQVLAVKGQGDVSGPGASVDGNLAAFSGTTGKVLYDSGLAWVNLSNGNQWNRFVNPSCQIAQRSGGGAVTANSGYAIDQFYALWSSSAAVISSQIHALPTIAGSANRVRVSVTTPDTSLASSEYLIFRSKLEGFRIQDFQWGTAAAKPIIVVFDYRGPSGTYSIALRNSDGTRSYIKNFTIASGQANTDTRQEFFVPGDTAGTWQTTTNTGIEFSICLALGSSHLRATEGWGADGLFGTPANTNGMAANANFIFSDFDMYPNTEGATKARAFVTSNQITDLSECMRYWAQVSALASGNFTSGTGYYCSYKYPVAPRVSPTLSGSSISASGFPATTGALTPISNGCYENRIANANGAGVFGSTVTIDASL